MHTSGRSLVPSYFIKFQGLVFVLTVATVVSLCLGEAEGKKTIKLHGCRREGKVDVCILCASVMGCKDCSDCDKHKPRLGGLD